MDEQESGVPRWAVRIETKLAELAINTERNDRHLLALREDFTDLRDSLHKIVPRVEDHTNRIAKIEDRVEIQGHREANWQGIAKGAVLVTGGLIAGAGLVIAIVQLIR